MGNIQAGILSSKTSRARYLVFSVVHESELKSCLAALAEQADGEKTVVGLGQSLLLALGEKIPGLCTFSACSGKGIEVPSTPAALWCWLRGDDRGELYHRSRQIESLLMPAFMLDEVVDTFQYGDSLDLSGYEDGTENPTGDDAVKSAIVRDQGDGMNGSSFVAVQQWAHDFDAFDAMLPDEQDNAIGRRKSDNEELDDAPGSAHVKRTAQESFTPEAFVVRCSMPWVKDMEGGLYFVAFCTTLDAFEVQLNRMIGAEDGITDALFNFTRPITGSYFWCPPMRDGKLDLALLGI